MCAQPCNQALTGRYVSLQLYYQDFLHFYELEVYGAVPACE